MPRVHEADKPTLDQNGNIATRVLHGSRRKEPLLPLIVISIGLTKLIQRLFK